MGNVFGFHRFIKMAATSKCGRKKRFSETSVTTKCCGCPCFGHLAQAKPVNNKRNGRLLGSTHSLHQAHLPRAWTPHIPTDLKAQPTDLALIVALA